MKSGLRELQAEQKSAQKDYAGELKDLFKESPTLCGSGGSGDEAKGRQRCESNVLPAPHRHEGVQVRRSRRTWIPTRARTCRSRRRTRRRPPRFGVPA